MIQSDLAKSCFSRLPDDSSPVPKHVGADTHHELYSVTHILLYFGARGGLVLRHYATNRQVAGSIPDGVIGIFQ